MSLKKAIEKIDKANGMVDASKKETGKRGFMESDGTF